MFAGTSPETGDHQCGHGRLDQVRITHRFATAADIDAFYGSRPWQTIKAVVVLRDEKPVVVIGLDMRADEYILFSDVAPEFEPHLKSIPVMRALKTAQRMWAGSPMPVRTYDSTNPALLERLGFIEIRPGVHEWPH